MTDRDTLLREIDAFCEREGMSETRFGRAALNDGHFLRRLREGGNITLRTVERVRAFMCGGGTPRQEAA
jgi:TnpA family transposase